MKNTKRALLTSVLALVMCVVMLVGSTFAWFTDNVESLNNKIVAGKLDVELYMYNETTKAFDDISASKAPIFGDEDSLTANSDRTDTLWEPGKTQVAYFQVKNNGNLSLKYQVAVIARDDNSNLYEVMEYVVAKDTNPGDFTDWTTGAPVALGTTVEYETEVLKPGATQNFALALHMLEEAGNEYQEGEMSFDIKLLATQAVDEADYFDNTYDENAAYPVTTVDELKDAIAAGEPTIALGNDMEIDETIAVEKDLTINLQGHEFKTDVEKGRSLKVTANDVKLAINAEGTTNAFGNGTYGVVELAANVKDVEVEITGGTFTGTTDAGAFIKVRDGVTGTITLNHVNYKDDYTATAGSSLFAVVMGVSGTEADVDVVVNGGSYESATGFVFNEGVDEAVFNDVALVTEGYGYMFGGNKVTINGGSVKVGGTKLDATQGMPTAAFIACNGGNIEINETVVRGSYEYVGAVLNSGGTITANKIQRKNAATISDYKVWDQDAGCTGTVTVNGAVKISK